MAFHQHTLRCPEHQKCHAIVCETDTDVTDDGGAIIHPAGSIVWISHAKDSKDPAKRANPDHPYHGIADGEHHTDLIRRTVERGLLPEVS